MDATVKIRIHNKTDNEYLLYIFPIMFDGYTGKPIKMNFKKNYCIVLPHQSPMRNWYSQYYGYDIDFRNFAVCVLGWRIPLDNKKLSIKGIVVTNPEICKIFYNPEFSFKKGKEYLYTPFGDLEINNP